MPQLSQGQVLGRYELLLPVARGGMAEVWAARLHGSRGFRKIVALKTILPGAIDNERMEQMFLAEAELASRIEHPNVVQTLELGEQAGTLYLVLEWVEGDSLSALLARAGSHGGVPLPIAVNIIGQACKGLHAAHELTDSSGKALGVVHRDISPQNVLVGFSGTVKLVDFGIAKATQNSCTLTEVGEVKGKLAYMAPEQLRGAANVDRRADIFSMGTLLYAMTTGRHPFRGDHPGVTLKNITTRSSVPPPSTQVEEYPAELEAVVLRALKKNPSKRFGSAYEMLQALERAMPEALERSYDARVAEFVTQSAGTGAHERQHQIRNAGELLDRVRARSGASLEPTSPSSLSALAIDGSSESQHSVSSLTAAAADSESELLRAKRSRSKMWAMAVGAVVAGTTLGLVVGGGSDDTSKPSSAGAEAPSAGSASWLTDAAPLAAAKSQPQPATPSARAAPPDSASLARDTERAPSHVNSPTAKARVAPTRMKHQAVTKAAAKPAASAAPPIASEAQLKHSPAQRSEAKVNAWDPESFGTRQ